MYFYTYLQTPEILPPPPTLLRPPHLLLLAYTAMRPARPMTHGIPAAISLLAWLGVGDTSERAGKVTSKCLRAGVDYSSSIYKGLVLYVS